MLWSKSGLSAMADIAQLLYKICKVSDLELTYLAEKWPYYRVKADSLWLPTVRF